MKSTTFGIGWSVAIHLCAAAALKIFLTMNGPAIVIADLDLSMSTLVPIMSNEGGRGGMAAESWEVNSTKKKIDRNVVARSIVQEPEVESGPIGSGTGVNGSDDGHGAFVSASQTALKPKWLKNFIREEDYPLSARRSGVDGQVVLEVLIDEHGAVRDARLLKGADEALNQLALAKIHEAIFSPAYDASGQAVACKVVVPIRFHLK